MQRNNPLPNNDAALAALPTGFGRRTFLAAAGAAVSSVALGRDYGPQAPPVRYPDPDIVVLDKRFENTRSATRRSSGCTPVRCGRKAPPGTASGATCCGATSPTTCNAGGSTKTAT